MRGVWLVVALCASIGCGDNARAQPRSGSRIALRAYRYEDGARQLVRGHYFDRERVEECVPQRWADGSRYCTPLAAETVFADAQCLTRVARLPVDSVAAYAVDRHENGLIARIYRLGDPFVSSSRFFWQLRNGKCLGPYSRDEDATYSQLLEGETHDAFVPINRSTIASGAALAIVYDVTGDGLRSPVAFWDDANNMDCVPRARPNAASTECGPIAASAASYFADASCTTAVTSVSTTAIPSTIELQIDDCVRTFATDQRIPCDPLWAIDSCVATAGSDDERCFKAGRELSLTPISRTRIEAARIHPVVVGMNADLLDDAFVHDSQFAADCAPMQRGEEWRCVPAATIADVVQRFADNECTVPISVAYVPTRECDAPSVFMRESNGALRRLDEPYMEALFHRPSANMCGEAPTPLRTRPHLVGPAVYDWMFAPVTIETVD